MSQSRHARLVWLIDGEVVMPKNDGPNRRAAEKLVMHHRSLGRIEDSDEALVQLVTMLAEACDCDPSNAGLWNQYRRALSDLRTLCGTEGQSDIDKLIAQLVSGDNDSSTKVRNATQRKSSKSSAADRKNRSDSGPASDAAPKTRRRSGNGNASGRNASVQRDNP